MAQRALVDTGVLYAAFQRRDEFHETGLSIVRDADRGALPQLVVLDFVLAETMNALTQQLAPADARRSLEMIEESEGLDIARTSNAVWAAGLATYRRVDRLSLVDSIIVAYGRERDRPYLYSFDTGFDGVEGLTRLNTNTDPYGP